ITNNGDNTVSVINTATNAVAATIPVGVGPEGVAATSDGNKIYVANSGNDNVSVIATATNAVTATIRVGSAPYAFGAFIQRAPTFVGTPGKSNCYAQSVAALARQFGGLSGAAAALGFSSVPALQMAILAFCGG